MLKLDNKSSEKKIISYFDVVDSFSEVFLVNFIDRFRVDIPKIGKLIVVGCIFSLNIDDLTFLVNPKNHTMRSYIHRTI